MSKKSWNIIHGVETRRSGVFKFQTGVDLDALKPLIDRVEDAHKRFSNLPILPDMAASLGKEVLVSGVFATNALEGGALTQEEVAVALDIPPGEKAREEKERRVANIGNAYFRAEGFGAYFLREEYGAKYHSLLLHEEMFLDLHKDITEGFAPHPEHDAGAYAPPEGLDDIKTLMANFIEWINSEGIYALSPLIRAPLAHYYFKLIHPFRDGNGRIGRMVEAMILKSAGYKYASFALCRYYLNNIDAYFSLFNITQEAEAAETYPNNAFVEFFLEGMLEVLNRHHDRVNSMTAILLFRFLLRNKLERKDISDRQYTIVSNLMVKGKIHKLTDIQVEPWYQSLYKKMTRHTIARDLKGLVGEKLISMENRENIRVLIP